MKNYTVIPNRISSLFSPNDLYTLIGLYFTANSNYSTDSTYLQIADITKQSFSYIKDNFIPRLEKSGFCDRIEFFTQERLKRKRYFLPHPQTNFRIIQKEVLENTDLTSEEKGFIIALYCNTVNNSFNLTMSWKFWEEKIKVKKSTFYKIRKSLINKGYLKKLEDVPENPESEDYPHDYMLCVSWLGHINYENWLEMAAISEDVPKSMYVYKDKQQYYYIYK